MAYTLTVGAVSRQLQPVQVSATKSLLLIELLGDTELTNAVADAMVALVPPGCDLIFTVATSAIPLAHALSERTGLPYLVARKRRRTYMDHPLIQEVESMTLGVGETLWLDGRHVERVRGKKAVLLTDVVVSGSTLAAMARLVERAGGVVVGRLAAFARTGATDLGDISAVATLPKS
jgi:adenine phosphoribosyltransferase